MNNKKTIYIAFLRGINVGGHNVKMDILRNHFTELGFENVRSYIQSGNVFFESDENEKVLRNKIEKHLAASLGYPVAVCLRSITELEKMLKDNPFKEIPLTPDKRFSILFLAEPTNVDLPIPYITPDGGYELIHKTSSELFVVWYLKDGRPSNAYGLIEKKTQVKVTTRFWHTTIKILAAAKQK